MLQRSQEAENKTLSGREGMRDTYRATIACVGTVRRGCYRTSAQITHVHSSSEADLLGVTGHSIQKLLGGVERSDITRDEDRLPGEIYDCGNAGSVRVKPQCILLKPL